jgi:hypothetical protein
MTVSAATKYNNVSSASAESLTTGSIATTSGNLIVVIIGYESYAGSTDPSGTITCADSLVSSYIPLGNVGNASSWSQGLRIFSCVSNGMARTITADTTGGTNYQFQMIVLELSSASGSVTGLITNDNAGDGAITLTLTAAPGASDMTVFARLVDGGTDDAPPTFTMGSGWNATVEANAIETEGGGVFGICTRTGSTSATVSCTDATSATGSYASGKCMALAITFTAGGGGTTTSAVLASGAFSPIVDASVQIGGAWKPITEVQVLANGVWNPIVP